MLRTRDIRALQDKARKSECSKHPGYVLIVRNDELTCWYCNGPPEAFRTTASETEKYQTGAMQSAAIHSKMAQKHGAWEMTTEVTDVALIEPTQTDIERVGTKFAEQVENFGATGDAKLSRADLVLAAKLEMAGFQAFHLFVQQRRYQSQGKWHVKSSLYMNVKGRYFNAQRSMGPAYGGVTLQIISDPAIRNAAEIEEGEVLVQATLTEKRPDGTEFIRQQSFGRAGGSRDEKQPVAKANKLEMAETRAEARVLERGAALGVPIGTYAEVAGVAVVSDGPAQVKALEAPATWPAPDEAVDPSRHVELDDEGNMVDGTGQPMRFDVKTGEIINRNNAENRQELADRLKANGVTKEQVESLDLNPSQMLIDGSEPHFIADAISALLKPAEPQVRVEGDEEVQELPW